MPPFEEDCATSESGPLDRLASEPGEAGYGWALAARVTAVVVVATTLTYIFLPHWYAAATAAVVAMGMFGGGFVKLVIQRGDGLPANSWSHLRWLGLALLAEAGLCSIVSKLAVTISPLTPSICWTYSVALVVATAVGWLTACATFTRPAD